MINMFLYTIAINSSTIEKTRDWSIKSEINSKRRQYNWSIKSEVNSKIRQYKLGKLDTLFLDNLGI